MNIEIGKCYRTRDGRKAFVSHKISEGWRGFMTDGRREDVIWWENGRQHYEMEFEDDLAAEWGDTPSGIEALVCADIAARQSVGLAKYGRSVAEAAAAGEDMLQHLYQELLDSCVYIRAEIERRKAV